MRSPHSVSAHPAKHLIGAVFLLCCTAAEADLTATFNAAADVPLTTSSYTASGDATFTLNFAPEPGTNLTVVKNTGLPFIAGTFNNLANGAAVNLSFNGSTYPFIAWYYGGEGNNDLVLLWPYTGVAAWGRNQYGQLGDNTTTQRIAPVAVDQSGLLSGETIVQVVRQQYHSLALTSKGQVYAWGDNAVGQLGDNTKTQRHEPVAVNTASGTSALFGKTVVSITAGWGHSLALCSDGTLAAWGYNYYGQLGDNSTIERLAPVAVNISGDSALFGKSVVDIAAGSYHCLALCSDGTVVAWGQNSYSQLGDYTTTQRNKPVAVNTSSGDSALFGKTVVALSAGHYHSIALCSDGGLAAWGYNNNGQLGNNSTTQCYTPAAVNTDSGVSALFGKTVETFTTGDSHSLALCTDGTLVAWGYNANGQIGDNTTTRRLAPVAVNNASGTSALFGKKVVALSAGYSFSLVQCSDGTLAAWGYNLDGELGDNNLFTRPVPVAVNTAIGTSALAGQKASGLANASSMANHSLAIYGAPLLEIAVSGNSVEIAHGDAMPSTADHTDFGGTNLTGGSVTRTFTITNRGFAPLSLTGTPKIVISGTHAADFTVTTQPVTPVAFTGTTTFQITFDPSALGIRSAMVTIANDDADESLFTFGIQGTGSEPEISVEQPIGASLAVGGTRNFGPLPVGSTKDLVFTIKNTGGIGSHLTDLGITLDGVDAGEFSIVSSPTVPVEGPSGSTSFIVRFTPKGTGTKSAALYLASNDSDESLFNIQLAGTTTTAVSATFSADSDVGATLSAVNAMGLPLNVTLNYAPTPGTNLTVVKNTGPAFIQGIFNGVANGAPVNLTFNGNTYPFIAWYYGGDGNDLVLLWPYTSLVAWGNNQYGQLGDNTTTQRSTPVAVDLNGALAGKTIVQVVRGRSHTLALTSEGRIYGWGDNFYGQLGDNTMIQRLVPVEVNAANGTSALFGKTAVAIAAGEYHSVALCSDGTAVAWGHNNYGQLGDGTATQRNVPVSVNAINGTSALFGKTVAALKAGSYHSLVLCSDGTLAAWGANLFGQLGDNTGINSYVPALVNAGSGSSALFGKVVVSMSACAHHSLALCSDGTLVAWGWNSYGQVGDTTTTQRYAPVAVNTTSGTSSLFGKSVVAITAGSTHSLALCSDGTLAAWGYNVLGQLGDNTAMNRYAPVEVNAVSGTSALFGKTVVTIMAGSSYSQALCTDGTLAAWGSNSSGQLGDTTQTHRYAPVEVGKVSVTSVLVSRKASGLAGSGSSATHSLAIYGAPLREIAISSNSLEIANGDTMPSSADHTDFGKCLLTAASVVRTFTITSSGLTALNLTGTPKVVIGGPHAADFTVTTQPISPVAPFIETSTFQVTFDPSALGTRSATVSIASDDSDENPYIFSIQGLGSNVSAPSTTTAAATGITFNGATLDGKVNANNSERAVFFDYGTTTSYGSSVAATPGTVTGNTLTNVAATITGLLPHTKYNFRVRAAGPLGAANGANITLTTLNRAPVATGEPLLALPSAKVTISVLSNDADPDGDALSITSFTQPGASVGSVAKVGTDLVFTPSATFTGGSFTYTAADALGLKSNVATVTLQLADCTLGPDVTIPADSPPYDLTVSATGPWTVIESLSWLSFVPPAPGATSVRFIPAPNPSKDSRTGTVKIGGKTHMVTQRGVLVAPVLTTPAPISNAAISANYDLIIPTLNGPVTYTTTGMPKGLVLSNVTGHITGYPTEAKTSSVTVRAKNVWGDSNTISFDISVLPFPPALAGGYSATIADSETLTDKFGGLMTMTVTNTGGVTGMLKLGTGSHPFTGRLNTAINPLTPDPDHAVLKASVKRAGKPAVDLTVNTNSISTDLIEGDVTLPGAVPISAALTGSKHVWQISTRPADQFKGYFTTALEPTDTSASIPQGNGFMTFSVSAAGAVSWSGQLADGTLIAAQSATLWANGEWPLFSLLYANKGSLNQRLSIASGTKIVSGAPHWHKKPQTARAYAVGFEPTTLSAAGAEYLPPGTGQTLLNIAALGSANIDFMGGGMDSVNQFSDLDQVFNLSATHVAAFAGVNPALVKLTKIDIIKGTFTGTMTLKDNNPFNAALPHVSRPVNFNGVLLPTAGRGTGYFLLPSIAGPPANVTTSPMTSGQVRMVP
jgi:alpha-tubulin suppressor-like RCC1 family protein